MTDEERIRELIRQEMEQFIKEHGWPDAVVRDALIELRGVTSGSRGYGHE